MLGVSTYKHTLYLKFKKTPRDFQCYNNRDDIVTQVIWKNYFEYITRSYLKKKKLTLSVTKKK